MSIAMRAVATATVADLIESLGGISPDRIRLRPVPGTATVEDVVRIEETEKRLFELVDGVLVEKIMGFTESRLAIAIAAALTKYLEADDLGTVTGPDGMIRFPASLVRMPDVAFVPWDQFPNGEITDEAAPEVVPGLAVEVLSLGNTQGEMSRKLREYFSAGVPIVWFVDPRAKSVKVFTSPTQSKIVALEGTLDGGEVLPGFQLPVASVFATLNRRRKPKRNGS
jgi:Uma2 family endonuclease